MRKQKGGCLGFALLLDLISVLVAFFGGGSLRPTLCLYFCNRRKGIHTVSYSQVSERTENRRSGVTLKSTPPRCFCFCFGFFEEEEEAAAPPFGRPMALAREEAGVLGQRPGAGGREGSGLRGGGGDGGGGCRTGFYVALARHRRRRRRGESKAGLVLRAV